MTKVRVRLQEASEPLMFEALNTYTKGPLFCLRLTVHKTLKFPLESIFSITEEDGYTSQELD
jgi:hypothetical protein